MARIYQDANSGWIVFDGTEKHTFGVGEEAALSFYRRLQMTSAIVEFQADMDSLGQQVEAMLPVVDKANDLFLVNNLQALIDATASGELVGDSTFVKESLSTYIALLDAFTTFSTATLGDTGLTPKQIVRLRG